MNFLSEWGSGVLHPEEGMKNKLESRVWGKKGQKPPSAKSKKRGTMGPKKCAVDPKHKKEANAVGPRVGVDGGKEYKGGRVFRLFARYFIRVPQRCAKLS